MRAVSVFAPALFCVAVPTGHSQTRLPYNNQQLFLNGTNIAWVNFANDLGPGPLDTVAFRTVYDSIHAHGGNALRLWLHTDGTQTPEFDGRGRVTGPGAKAIPYLQKILDMAWQRHIGLILCLWSFDMQRSSIGTLYTTRNALMLTDTGYSRSYIDNALIPMAEAVKGHPAIIAWEVFNEPEGMSNEFGWGFTYHVPMSAIQTFTNLVAGAIHRVDPAAKVTTGAWALTSESDVTPPVTQTNLAAERNAMTTGRREKIEADFASRYGVRLPAAEIVAKFLGTTNVNYYRDDRLVAAGGDPQGTLDFYTDHYYDWQSTPLSPFLHPCSTWALTKPLVIAEFFPEQTLTLPYTALYDTLYANGYAGALSWGWYSGASGHPQGMLQANTVTLVQDISTRYPADVQIIELSGTLYSFSARPARIDSGESSLLSWRTAAGTTATLDGGAVPASGSATVMPGATTSYTLMTNGTVSDTSVVTVNVYRSGAIISFGGSSATIARGDQLMLRWRAAHGSAVTLDDSLVNRADSLVVRPGSTKTYTLIAAGTVRDTAVVTVTVVPVDLFNRAFGRPVSVSGSSTNPTYFNPQNLVDGDTLTAWMSTTANSQWVNCDLGQTYQIRRMVIYWGWNYATSYLVECGPDGFAWDTLRAVTGATGGKAVFDSLNGVGRIVRIWLSTRLVNAAGGFVLNEIEVYGTSGTSAAGGEDSRLPDRFALAQNYPNPFNPSTTIRFALPAKSRVTIVVFNILGQQVAELLDGEMEAGYHSILWSPSVASGVYLCRVKAVSASSPATQSQGVIKLLLLR